MMLSKQLIIVYLVLACFIAAIAKVYYHLKLKVQRQKTRNVIAKWIFEAYTLQLMLPIFRNSINEIERALIQKANLCIYICYAILILLAFINLDFF
jgi:hypothetical protein